MILDEPNAFLDFRNKKEILDLLQRISGDLKKTIIFSTHDIEASLQHCTKVWLMTEEKQFFEIEKSAGFAEEIKAKLHMEN